LEKTEEEVSEMDKKLADFKRQYREAKQVIRSIHKHLIMQLEYLTLVVNITLNKFIIS